MLSYDKNESFNLPSFHLTLPPYNPILCKFIKVIENKKGNGAVLRSVTSIVLQLSCKW